MPKMYSLSHLSREKNTIHLEKGGLIMSADVTTGNNNLRYLREQRKLSLRDLAGIVGMSFSNIASIERGEVPFNTETLRLFCDFFGCTADYMLNRKPLSIMKLGYVDPEKRKYYDYIDADGVAYEIKAARSVTAQEINEELDNLKITDKDTRIGLTKAITEEVGFSQIKLTQHVLTTKVDLNSALSKQGLTQEQIDDVMKYINFLKSTKN